MAVEEHTFASAAEAARALADAVAADLVAALQARPAASLVVSGGRSPIAFFELLRDAAIDWAQVSITLADERWVPPEHADSNARLVAEHLLQGPAAAARFVPLWNGAPTPADAIVERSRVVGTLPRPFDAVVLGMGEDGHTASLFPGMAGLAAALDPTTDALLAATVPPAAAHARISFTLRALLDSRRIYLPLGGAAKQAVYREASATHDARRWPIAAVLAQAAVPVRVFLSP
jgi:6-phosphogluconolactonase